LGGAYLFIGPVTPSIQLQRAGPLGLPMSRLERLAMKKLLMVVGLLSVMSTPALAEVKLYLMMGASWTFGTAPVTHTTPVSSPRIWTYRLSGAYTNNVAEPVFGGPSQYPVLHASSGAGPARYFARLLHDKFPHDDIVIVPCPVAGAEKYVRAEDTLTFYGACMARWKAALRSPHSPEGPRKVAGVFMIDGLANAFSEMSALSWGDRFTQLIEDLRVDTGNPDLKAVFGRLVPPAQCAAKWYRAPFFKTVFEVQDALEYPGVKRVVIANTPLQSDCMHPTGWGNVRVGEVMAEAMWALETKQWQTVSHSVRPHPYP
jgi:hypothetical protein